LFVDHFRRPIFDPVCGRVLLDFYDMRDVDAPVIANAVSAFITTQHSAPYRTTRPRITSEASEMV
jgi:hypothetical protein